MNIWAGEFGDAYTRRNPITEEALEARSRLWSQIIGPMLPDAPRSILEVGANVGINLLALRGHLRNPRFFAAEPNAAARDVLREAGFDSVADTAGYLRFPRNAVDLVFTSGVLIHIPPDELLAACTEIHRCSSRWIVAIEYFSQQPREIEYRGEMGRLWLRDFGAFYLDNFPDLHPVACGFAWKRMTGLDDLTWWLLEKR